MAEYPPVATPNLDPFGGEKMSTDQITQEQVSDLVDLPSQFKKGYKTSEFWVSALPAVALPAAFVAKAFGVDVDTETLLAALGAVVPSVFYVIGRSWLKRKRVEAVAETTPVPFE